MTQIEIKPPKTRSARPVVPVRPRGTPADAAADAAGLLRRLGFAVMVGLLPIASVIMRHAVVGLAPVGAILFALAMLIESDGREPLGRILALLRTPIALALIFLVLWAGLSLLWTPFYDDAQERLVKAIGVGLAAFAAGASMPVRMRASNLYLLALGSGLGALAAIVWVVTVPNAYTAIDGDGPVMVRTAMSVTLLAWPALAWLMMRSERAAAILLALAVACAVLLSGSSAAVLALLAGAVGFGLTSVAPRLVIPLLTVLLALAVLAAPLLPFAMTSLFQSLPDGATALKPLLIWRDSVVAEPIRLLTGHGLDTALRSQLAGILALGAPQSILFEIWYELGLLGVLPVAFILVAALRSAAVQGEAIAPCLVGAILNLLAFACLGLVGSQTWWLTLIATLSIAFIAVIHGRFGTRRPKAVLGR